MPGHAFLADTDRITDRTSPVEHAKELALVGNNHNAAGRVAAAKRFQIAGFRRGIAKRNQRNGDETFHPVARQEFHRCTITGLPTDSMRKSLRMSSLCIWMQPCEMNRPIEEGRLVREWHTRRHPA